MDSSTQQANGALPEGGTGPEVTPLVRAPVAAAAAGGEVASVPRGTPEAPTAPPSAGEAERVAADMGTTNGIEVSPDGKTLYVTARTSLYSFKMLVKGHWYAQTK
jgi:hypothetical protein